MYKRIFQLLLSIVMIFSICINVNANEAITTTNEETLSDTFPEENSDNPHDFLLGKGFTDEYLSNLPEDYINELYNKFKSDNVMLGDIKHSKWNPEESSESGIMPYGTIPGYMLDFKITSIWDYNDNTTAVNKIEINIVYEWYCVEGEERPYNRGLDGMTANWDTPFKYVIGSFSHTDYKTTIQYYLRSASSMETSVYNATTEMCAGDARGIGYDVSLPKSSLVIDHRTYTKCTGITKFSIEPKDANSIFLLKYNPNHRSASNVGITYAHDKGTPGAGISFSTPVGLGVSMSFDSSRYDSRFVPYELSYANGRDDKYISIDKQGYYPGEKINILVNNAPTINSWIGIYPYATTNYQNNSQGMWCYVGTGSQTMPDRHKSSNELSLTANQHDITNNDLIPLTPGRYKIVLFLDDGYSSILSKDFTVYPAIISASRISDDLVTISYNGAMNKDAWIGIYPESQQIYNPSYPSILWYNTDGKISGTKTVVLNMQYNVKYKAVLFSNNRYYPIASCIINPSAEAR